MYSPLVLGVTTTVTSGMTTAATDIQSHMEKYLTADVDSVNELDGDSDGNSINAEDDDSARFNNIRSRSRGFSGAGDSRSTMTTTSAHHRHMTSGVECKVEADVLDLHKDGGGSGASGLSSGNAESARNASGRWSPLTSRSSPSSHHCRQSPPHHQLHPQQPVQPMDISSPVLPRLCLGATGPSAAFLQQRNGRPQSDKPPLGRFRSGVERFQLVSTGSNQHQPGADASAALAASGRGQSSVGDGHSQLGSVDGKAGHNRGVKSYHCRMCEQEFANKSDMQRHAKEAHRMEDKGHKCMQCLKSFPSSQQLAQHSLVHSNVRKYSCSYCDKAFKQLSHVQQHQRIHTGERPYRCPVDGCSKAFRQLSSLQQHLKGHNIPLPKSYQVTRAIDPRPAAVSAKSPPLSESPPSGNESFSRGNRVNSGLARPHDLTCQVCEKHCADEVRFFCHIHKYHPDYWRVFSGGRPLSDFIETNSNSSSSPTGSEHHHHRLIQDQQPMQPPQQQQPASPAHHREKRFVCSICHKRYSHETGYVKHMAGHSGFSAAVASSGGGQAAVSTAAAAAAAVDELLSNGSGRLGGGWLTSGDDGGSHVSLFNCPVCSKLFTKEAYLLRHMEMKLDPGHAAGLEELKKNSGMFRVKTDLSPPIPVVGGGLTRPPPNYRDEEPTGGGFMVQGGGGCLEPTSMVAGRCDPDIGYRIRKMLRPDSIEDDGGCSEDVDDRVMSPPSNNYVDRADFRRTPSFIGLCGGGGLPLDIALSARRQFHNQMSRTASCVSPLSSSSSAGGPPSPPTSFASYVGGNNHSDNPNSVRGSSSSSSYASFGPSATSASNSTALLQRYQPLPVSSEFLRRCSSVDGRLNLHRPIGYHTTDTGLPMHSPSVGINHSPRTSADMDDGRGDGMSSSPEMDHDRPSMPCPSARYLPESQLDDHHQNQRRSTPTEFYSPPSPYMRFRSVALGVPPLPVSTPSRVEMVSPGLVGVGGHIPPGTSLGYPQLQYYSSSHLHDAYLRRATGAAGSGGDVLDREVVHGFR